MVGGATAPGDFQDPQLFINRELSWLAFNDRVLRDAADATLPLLERLKFLAIVSSNLDEFFMVRVAGLQQQRASGVAETGPDGMLPEAQLIAISEQAHAMIDELYALWRDDLAPKLAEQGLHLLSRDELDASQRAAAKTCFQTQVFPALTPLAVDPARPFPHLRSKSLNLAVTLRRQAKRKRRPLRETALAVVQVPSVLPRLVPIPAPANAGTGTDGKRLILLEDLIALHVGELFPGYTVDGVTVFRVTRNWDLNVDEEESEDLLFSVQEELRRRDRGNAVRLELDAGASAQIETDLITAIEVTPRDVYRVKGPLQLQDLTALGDYDRRPELRVEPFVPALPPALREVDSIIQAVGERDILLHHPYESFDPVVRFIEEAAEDPNVLAIKQTLYRTSGDSPIPRALSRAVENGKQVAVLVEIKARLDEANNIAWARRLEENGVHVVYGLIGLKTHCKVALVVRKEGGGIRRYVHLGTGNYNPNTARLYTDVSLFTARPELADDATMLFNLLTGYSVPPSWRRLAVAPMKLQEKVLALISREAERAKKGEPARILAKMNSLVDATTIRALYAASQAGVQIDLVVRGICCLRPGVPGVSDNIRVTSVVDRFLEHSRVFAFGAENPDVFLSSADWMPRNFLRRIEVMFPVEDPILRARILDEAVLMSLRDNVKARRLQRDGTYVRVPTEGTPVRSQALLLAQARKLNEPAELSPRLRQAIAPPDAAT